MAMGLALLALAACSSGNSTAKEAGQNARQWGASTCQIAKAQDSTSQSNAYGQARHFSAQTVSVIPSMQAGANEVNALVDQLNTDKTANALTKMVPDLRAIQDKASSLAGSTSGDESETWTALSGTISDCVAQLPPSLQGSGG